MTDISLITTVYNKANFLKRCLDSVVNQTTKCQVIVVNDESTDGSAEILKEYKKHDFEIYHIKHGGVSKARNFGISKARGEYIMFLDADDSLNKRAIESLLPLAKAAKHKVIQYNHSRYTHGPENEPVQRIIPKGRYSLEKTPKYWVYVWNKLYRKSFLDKHKIRFIEGMQFGEDEMFNVECLTKNDGLYQIEDVLINHYFDDNKSLCRSELNLDRIIGLDDALNARKEQAIKAGDTKTSTLLERVIARHRRSKTFNRFGFNQQNQSGDGKYDIVYFVKESATNEELKYSLRSVNENFKYHQVWFYGGCPNGIVPDRHVAVAQNEPTKWEKVRGMMKKACQNDEITESFWLFNDDFFVLKPVGENIPPYYNGSIYKQIVSVEDRHGQTSNDYTRRLRHLCRTLGSAKKDYLNYGVHKPMLINRKKMLEVLNKFPDEPMNRALYGNYWAIGGVRRRDVKIRLLRYSRMNEVKNSWEFVSTSDESFDRGEIGTFLRQKFNKPSRFEKG